MAWHRTRYRPLAARVLTGLLTAIAVVILVCLVLTLLEADPANPLVDFIAAIADRFSRLFHGMFTADDAKMQALIDYGLAAAAYLLVGALVHSLGRRTAG